MGGEKTNAMEDSSLAQVGERASPGEFLPCSDGTSAHDMHTRTTSPLQAVYLHPYILNHRLINHTHAT